MVKGKGMIQYLTLYGESHDPRFKHFIQFIKTKRTPKWQKQVSRKTELTFTKIIIAVYIHMYQRQKTVTLKEKLLLSHISHCFRNSKDFVNVVVKDGGEVRTRIPRHESAKWHFSCILAVLHIPDLRHAAAGPGDEEKKRKKKVRYKKLFFSLTILTFFFF